MSVPPGWYRDPVDHSIQRWWDGEGWVGDPIPADATPPPGPPTTRPSEPQVPAVPGLPTAVELPPAGGAAAQERLRGRNLPQTPPRRGVGTSPGDGTPAWRPVAGPPTLRDGLVLAPLSARLVARLIDAVALLALNVAVNGWFVYQFWRELTPVLRAVFAQQLAGETGDLPQLSARGGNLLLVIVLIATALWFAYEVPAVANTGQTLGKRLMGIQVVRLDSAEPLTFRLSARRWNTFGTPTVLWYCCGIGLVLQLIDAAFLLFDRPLQQALHDKSANTVVVTVPRDDPARTPDKEASSDEPDPS